MLGFFSRALTVLGYLAAASTALIPLGFLFGRYLPVVDLFAQFLFGGILASLFLCVGALLIRSWRLAAVAGTLLLLCVGLSLPYEIAPQQAATDRHLRLLSFNIFFDNEHLD